MIKLKQQSRKKSSHLTLETRDVIRARDAQLNKAKNTNHPTDKLLYRQLRNKAVSMVRRDNADYLNNKLGRTR